MLRRLLWFPVALVVAILLVTLAVANREPVRMVLDPFRPDAPVISLTLPFYAYLLGALTIGKAPSGSGLEQEDVEAECTDAGARLAAVPAERQLPVVWSRNRWARAAG